MAKNSANGGTVRQWLSAIMAMAVIMAAPVGALQAQVQSVDPNTVIDADLNQPAPPPAPSAPAPEDNSDLTPQESGAAPESAGPNAATAPSATEVASANGQTFRRDDLIGAAEGVFGRGAEGLARMIEDVLREQGEPNGYIVGREAGGAFVLGLRYGSGTLHHRIEGTMPVYWTGPSVGIDAGANAGNTFVLVYNLHDTNDLYRRYAAGEGAAYLIGGFNGSYLRRGDIVLIPIRLGVGFRLGANVGYMNFSRRQRWLPF
jgi:hypothetical protein